MTTSSRTTIHYGISDSALGCIAVARSRNGVCAILFGDDRRALIADLRQRYPHAKLAEDAAGLKAALARVARFVDFPSAGIDLKLDVAGTEFQQRVWRALMKIPSGTTASYADIARAIEAPKSVRAVAQACGANALALAIPCHRVVRSDGSLSGYRWGTARKRALLEREASR